MFNLHFFSPLSQKSLAGIALLKDDKLAINAVLIKHFYCLDKVISNFNSFYLLEIAESEFREYRSKLKEFLESGLLFDLNDQELAVLSYNIANGNIRFATISEDIIRKPIHPNLLI